MRAVLFLLALMFTTVVLLVWDVAPASPVPHSDFHPIVQAYELPEGDGVPGQRVGGGGR